MCVAVGGKLYENSHSHAASESPPSLVGPAAGYKRPQPSSSSSGGKENGQLPRRTLKDFNFIKVLGKGSFGKVPFKPF